MAWASNLFVALVMLDITGTIFFLTGLLFRKTCFKDDVRWSRFQTAAVLGAFGIPFVYLILYADQWLVPSQNEKGVTNLFVNTPMMSDVFAVLGLVWITLFLLLLLYRIYRYSGLISICKGNIPEEDEEVQAMFDRVCEELGVSGKVSLARNDLIKMPCIAYYHGATVMLPLDCYSRQEIRVILYHELCHYVERDVLFKTAAIVINLLHMFNPIGYIVLKQMELLCEESCDRLACEKGKNEFTEQEYFDVIFKMLIDDDRRERYQLMSLVDTSLNYERRLTSMKRYHEGRHIRKGLALMFSVCFLLGSSMTALAVGKGADAAYGAVAEGTFMTQFGNEDEQFRMELAKQYNVSPDDVVIIGDEGIEPCGLVIDIDWIVPAGKIYSTAGFRLVEGQEVGFMLSASPEDLKIETGLQYPDLIMYGVEGSGLIEYTYVIEENGRYYFIVHNPSTNEESVTVQGSVIKGVVPQD